MEIEDIIVYVLWGFSAVVGVVIIGGAFFAGMSKKRPYSLIFWKRVKLISAVLSTISLVLFILSFEQLVRGVLQPGSKEWADDRFLELKLEVMLEKATACAKDDAKSQAMCGLWKNIDNGFHVDLIRAGHKLAKISDWQRGAGISSEVQEKINRTIETINGSVRIASLRPMFSSENRIWIAVFAAYLLIFAVAGSVGEAAFQYRQAQLASAKDDAKS
jgi:hypothetical protein